LLFLAKWLTQNQVEYLVVAVDDEAKKARLSLAQAEILKSLARDEALWKEKRSGPAHGKEQ
jgi:glutamate--cysteine ligase catalytic subunit